VLIASKKVLIVPLDWGLGHATRCIPIIRELIELDTEVIIASFGATESLLKREFPQLQHWHLKGYNIRFSSVFPIWFMILIQMPKICYRIIWEHQWLKKITRKEKIEVVISDNRFGLWNRKIKSVYITHQVMIKCPNQLKFLEPLLYRIHYLFISKYHACWIPDYEGERSLSGDLSHRYTLPINAKFIGPLSRFSNAKTEKHEHEVAAIISGANPHRRSLEKKISQELISHSFKSIIIRGIPSESNTYMNGTIKFVSHLSSDEMEDAIKKSKLVICRAGYSSIMDLIRLKKNAILIPTPGQTEQEYLADYLMQKQIFFSISQHSFNLEYAIEQSKKYSVKRFIEEENSDELLKQEIKMLNYRC
jgi:uncharacterized protein (TIGR00661 family)